MDCRAAAVRDFDCFFRRETGRLRGHGFRCVEPGRHDFSGIVFGVLHAERDLAVQQSIRDKRKDACIFVPAGGSFGVQWLERAGYRGIACIRFHVIRIHAADVHILAEFNPYAARVGIDSLDLRRGVRSHCNIDLGLRRRDGQPV